MIEADAFLGPARVHGLDFYAGVPCSFLSPLIDRVASDAAFAYVGAASEGEAVAIAAGAWLGGRRTVVMCQNSGLGNMVNPLTSLNHIFHIPTLLILTWRGGPGIEDEAQHALMGRITHSLLDLLQIRHRPFPTRAHEVAEALSVATAAMADTRLPFALVMEKGAVREAGLEQPAPKARRRGRRHDRRRHDRRRQDRQGHDRMSGEGRPSRVQVLERVLAAVPATAAIIATTGKCGRELFALADRPQHFYQVGSMGCASALGLGVALHVDRPVVVLDGDGAALMKMGTLATIGACAPPNLVHVVLDNGVHDSTGGQRTVSATVDFAEVATACHYAEALACDNRGDFESALAHALRSPGPHLIHMRIAPGSMPRLGRPTLEPAHVARRFQTFLAGA